MSGRLGLCGWPEWIEAEQANHALGAHAPQCVDGSDFTVGRSGFVVEQAKPWLGLVGWPEWFATHPFLYRRTITNLVLGATAF